MPNRRMLSALNQRLLSLAKAKIRPVHCPKCGEWFTPFADREIIKWSDFVAAPRCPHCGYEYRVGSAEGAGLTPSRPLPQPETSRIEKKPITEGQVLYYIPPTGSGRGLLAFAVIWNVFVGFFLAVTIGGMASGKSPGAFWLPRHLVVLLPFIAVGVGMAYAGLRAKYATHLLYLGPEFIRLQRQLFGRSKNYDLKTAEIDRAEQKEFYQQNRQPVYGIEIGAGKRRIRFGSALMDGEKEWLCAEIREFLRETGHPSF